MINWIKNKTKKAWDWTKRNTLKVLIGIGIIGVATAITIPLIPQGIPKEHQLKCPKEKILYSQEFDWKIYDDEGNMIEDKGQGVKYLYISETEVPQAIYQGLNEDISKRTKNAQFFPKGKNKEGKEEFIGLFYAGEPFYKDKKAGEWYQTKWGETDLKTFETTSNVDWHKLLNNYAFAIDEEYTGETSDGYIYGNDESSCPGTPTPCDEFDESTCAGQSNCSWDGCTGTADSCDTLSESDCEYQDGCELIEVGYGYECTGTATTCDGLSEIFCGATTSESQYGCSWAGCSGTATSCSYFDSDESGCGNQGGCSWDAADYASARNTSDGYSITSPAVYVGHDYESSEFRVNRGYLDFNTSSIPDDATVTDVKLNLKLYYNGSSTDFDVRIYKFTWSEPITSTNREANYDADAAEYDNLWRNTTGLSSGTRYDSSSLDNSWVNLTGDTKYQLRSKEDVDNSEPTNDEYISVYSANSAGNEPILYVTYIVATTPSVTTNAATLVEATTATGNGNITATGGANCTTRGFCYKVGTTGDPTTADSTAYDTGSFGTGAYTKGLTNLSTGTNYRVRAYAINSAGTGYGTTVQILTKPAAPINVAATDGTYTDKVTITWTKSTGATGYKVYEGTNLLDTLGDVATYDDTAAPAPTITPGTAVASDGASTAYVALSLSGQSANNGASRTYKVRATNATGSSGDSNTNAGYRGPGSLTYQWQRSAADSDASYSNIDGATTASYNDTGVPADGSGRYYKCVENATGAVEQTSSADRGYRAIVAPPSIKFKGGIHFK